MRFGSQASAVPPVICIENFLATEVSRPRAQLVAGCRTEMNAGLSSPLLAPKYLGGRPRSFREAMAPSNTARQNPYAELHIAVPNDNLA